MSRFVTVAIHVGLVMLKDSFANGATEFFSEEHSEKDWATSEYTVRTLGNHEAG